MRLKLEIIGAVILVAMLCLIGYEQYQKAVANAVATEVAQRLKEAQKPLDARLEELNKSDADRQKDYQTKTADLLKMTPQQIFVKVPQYVPMATAPITLVGADSKIAQTGEAKPGDAIVPQADIQPIAQKLLDGDKCSKDIVSCQQKVETWQKKFGIKQDEAGEWESAAKGGSIWKRALKDAGKIAIGVGVGYALHR